MKIAYLLLLFGSIITSSNYKLLDIDYNQEYTVDVSRFSENYIPASTSYYFRVKTDPNGKSQIKIKVLKGSIIDFEVTVCGFKDRPSDLQVLTGHNGCVKIAVKTDFSDSNYDIYLYNFETLEILKYISIYLRTLNSLYFLSFTLTNQVN